jgi:hypothetical protein
MVAGRPPSVTSTWIAPRCTVIGTASTALAIGAGADETTGGGAIAGGASGVGALALGCGTLGAGLSNRHSATLCMTSCPFLYSHSS